MTARRQTFVILSFFIVALAYSQKNITVTGRVIFAQVKQVFFPDIPVHLVINNKDFMTTKTNDKGEFTFTFKKTKGVIRVCFESVKEMPDGKLQPCGYKTCGEIQTMYQDIKITADTLYKADLSWPGALKKYCE